MNRNKSRLYQELNEIASNMDRKHIVESRAQHVIASATNLIKLINETFTEDEATELNRKLLLAIKNQQPSKFNNGLRKIRNENRRNIL